MAAPPSTPPCERGTPLVPLCGSASSRDHAGAADEAPWCASQDGAEGPAEARATPAPDVGDAVRLTALAPAEPGARAVPPRRLRRTPAWAAAVNSIAFMCVPRALPACFAATGWSLGLVSLVYSSIVTYDTGRLLGVVCAAVPAHCCSFPAVAAEAAGAWSAGRGHDAARQGRWRWAGGVAVGALQHSCYFLTGVTELIYFEQFMGQLFRTSPLCQWQWLLIVGLISLPFMQVPGAIAGTTRFFSTFRNVPQLSAFYPQLPFARPPRMRVGAPCAPYAEVLLFEAAGGLVMAPQFSRIFPQFSRISPTFFPHFFCNFCQFFAVGLDAP